MKVKKMSESPNSNPQIQNQNENQEENKKQVIDEILKKLKFAIEPEIKELVVLPERFMIIPTLQRFSTALYKFKKFKFNNGIAYFDGEGVIVYTNHYIKLYVKPRYSRKIYSIKYEYDYDLPEELRPRYYLLTDEGAQFVSVNYSEELVKYLFGLEIDLENAEFFQQGHLYIFKLWYRRNTEYWFIKEEENKPIEVSDIYGHKLVDAVANVLTNEIYYIRSEKEFTINHEEHGSLTLNRGEYLLFHPRPRNGKAD